MPQSRGHRGRQETARTRRLKAYKAVDQGALGVDMGRNIFGADDPVAMAQAVGAVVHRLEKPEQAFALYNDLKAKK